MSGFGISGIINSTFRGVRIILSSLGIGSSLGIAGYGIYFVVGGTTGGWAFVAMGAACLIPSIWMLRDATHILELIKEQGDRLEKENENLKQNNIVYQGENEKLKSTTSELMRTKDQYADQNAEYLKLLRENKIKLDSLSQLKTEIQTQNEKLKENVEETGKQNVIFVEENEELKTNVEKINSLREQFKRENSELQMSLTEAQRKLNDLELIKDKYSMENDRLHELITENTKQLTQLSMENNTLHNNVEENEKQIEQMKDQVTRLKELHKESIKLLANLREAGDIFTDFGNTIDGKVVQLDEATLELREEIGEQVDRLRELNEGLTKKMVEELKNKLDKNQDGIIDETEFQQYGVTL